jgi:dolichol-phosphate mannosyltransferase
VDGVPPYRLVFSFGASLMYRLLVKWNIYCWTSLFRAYRQPVIKSVSIQSNDFLMLTEVLVNSIRAGYKVVEYPTTLHVRTFGQSSMKIARVTKAHLLFQWEILKARLMGKSGPVSPVRRQAS